MPEAMVKAVDPFNVPLSIVEFVSISTVNAGCPYFEFCTYVPALAEGRNIEMKPTVVARVRINPGSAKFIRDEIDKHLAILAKPEGQAN